MFLRSPNESVFTPLVLRGIELFPCMFWYLYPFPLDLHVDSQTKILSMRKKPWDIKTLPWILVTTILTGLIGCGSCAYVCITKVFGLTSVKISIFSFTAALAELTAGLLQIGVSILVIRNPLFPTLFNQLFLLEKNCKIFILKNYIKLFSQKVTN